MSFDEGMARAQFSISVRHAEFESHGARTTAMGKMFLRDADSIDTGAPRVERDKESATLAGLHEVSMPDGSTHGFTTSGEQAKDSDDLSLLGMEHPAVRVLMADVCAQSARFERS